MPGRGEGGGGDWRGRPAFEVHLPPPAATPPTPTPSHSSLNPPDTHASDLGRSRGAGVVGRGRGSRRREEGCVAASGPCAGLCRERCSGWAYF